MNAGQLERVCGAEDCVAMPMGEKTSQAFDVARADIAAMRQPITAEALLADGWKFEAHEEAYAQHTATHDIFVELQGDNRPVVEVEWTCQGETHQMPVRHAENMYDLRELVRLLGGVK